MSYKGIFLYFQNESMGSFEGIFLEYVKKFFTYDIFTSNCKNILKKKDAFTNDIFTSNLFCLLHIVRIQISRVQQSICSLFGRD